MWNPAFGVDAAFSYKYNQNLGICAEDGIALSVGYMTSHSIPVSKIYPRITLHACFDTDKPGGTIEI